MLRGINPLNLDAKGRMAMPMRYRDELKTLCDGQLVLTVDRSRCLLVYPFPEWVVIEQKLVKLPALNEHSRRLQRLLIGYATEVELDGAGRILLPTPLREFAEIDKRVMLVGQGNKFELWNEDLWHEGRERWMTAEDSDQPLPAELESLSL